MTDTWLLTAWDTRNQDGQEDVVVQTRWKLTVTDEDGNKGTFDGVTPFSAADVPEGDFVAFEDLDEETVTGWITDYVDSMPGYREHIDGRIALDIADKVNPVNEMRPVPWNPDADVPPAPITSEPSDDVD